MELELYTPLQQLYKPHGLQLLLLDSPLLLHQTSIMTLPNSRLFRDRHNSEEVEVPQLPLVDGGYSMLMKVVYKLLVLILLLVLGNQQLDGNP